jgi:proteasome accessory factor C
MLPWVMANEGATVFEVCERFGYATSAELNKDLELVFVCGLPGYGPGELMDATLLDDEVIIQDADYFSHPLRLTAAEALVLLAAGNAVLRSSEAPPALASAVAKLQGVVSPDDRAMTIDLGIEPDTASTLRSAARTGSVVTIEYTAIGSGITTVRQVEPWAIFSKLGNWYLTGHCRLAGGERIFRLDRIRRLEVTDERFDPTGPRPDPDVGYTPSADDVRATMALSPRAKWVAEYYPVEVIEDGDRLVVEFAASDPLVTARLLIRLGGEAVLVAGEDVARSVAALRERILTRYR